MGMNLNFHHRYHQKCVKCHKIHKKNQHEPNIKLSSEKTSGGLLFAMNNRNKTKKDININTEEIADKELNEYTYLYENQPAHMNRNGIDGANQELPLNPNHKMSQRHESFKYSDDYTKIDIPGDTVNTNPFEKLRQLQKQRASSEYYYSQEIQKIIGEYFTSDYGNNKNRSSKSIENNRHTRADIPQGFEQCGVITSITQLDCGCVQKSKRPIYISLDTRTDYIHSCADGIINGDIEDINCKNLHHPQISSQDEPLSFTRLSSKPWHGTTTEQIVHRKPPKFNSINSRHSFPKPESSTKLHEDTFHRTNNY